MSTNDGIPNHVQVTTVTEQAVRLTLRPDDARSAAAGMQAVLFVWPYRLSYRDGRWVLRVADVVDGKARGPLYDVEMSRVEGWAPASAKPKLGPPFEVACGVNWPVCPQCLGEGLEVSQGTATCAKCLRVRCAHLVTPCPWTATVALGGGDDARLVCASHAAHPSAGDLRRP